MESKEMLKVYEAVKGDLSKLSAKLGTTGKAVFSWYVKDQKISGFAHIGWGILYLFVAMISAFWFFQETPKLEYGNDYPDWFITEKIFGGAGLLGSVLLAFLMFHEAARELFNPEYWAFSNLIGDLRDNTNESYD